jgi:hypothetical protein
MSAQLTHDEAIDRIVESIIDQEGVDISRLREALLAITSPPELLGELAADLKAVRMAVPVPLEQQVADWQAMALRISGEKARLEKNIAVVADDVAELLEEAKKFTGAERGKILGAAIQCALDVLTAFSPRHNFNNAIRLTVEDAPNISPPAPAVSLDEAPAAVPASEGGA